MKNQILTIEKQAQLQDNVFSMTVHGDFSEISRPGQFINIKIQGFFLRRPISVSTYNDNSLTIIYKVVGKGTEILSKMHQGDTIEALLPLGNGFNTNIDASLSRIFLVGGGIGVPPLLGLSKELLKKHPTISIIPILGFNTKSDIILLDEFQNLQLNPIITTADGSFGEKGFVTDAIKKFSEDNSSSYIFACGPEAMLKAVHQISKEGQYSFEARMGCGFGGCMGCSCKTKYGYKRICLEGPVLSHQEIIW